MKRRKSIPGIFFSLLTTGCRRRQRRRSGRPPAQKPFFKVRDKKACIKFGIFSCVWYFFSRAPRENSKINFLPNNTHSPGLQCCAQSSSWGPPPIDQSTCEFIFGEVFVNNTEHGAPVLSFPTFRIRSTYPPPPPVPRRSWVGRRGTPGSRSCPCCTPALQNKNKLCSEGLWRYWTKLAWQSCTAVRKQKKVKKYFKSHF